MRSKFESTTAAYLKKMGAIFEYEGHKIEYVWPERKSKYIPDFLILRNGIFIETKGRFVSADRKKHLLIKEQHPEIDIRFCFLNAYNRLSKTSKTTYADWCDKNGFLWCHKIIPKAWLKSSDGTRTRKRRRSSSLGTRISPHTAISNGPHG